ncbi:ArsR family transcriptional regulator [Frondihabitans sp. PAMC 28766]|uniref:winged helix-turn-helix domain-containing protein n=1 Tax=Frondihabitans sp. PAMC 28766 TaxID=1795630 RepID=UPI00078B40D1|nr:transcriptional regulator [Frondihabitans sp. PAMC 28766]AMM21429.1 ArsR family transcriptional regulator [Frondihabitans sp. PAMC 28766]
MTATEHAHPRHRLSDVLQNPIRFSIAAALDRAERLSFAEVRDAVEITDSALSKQVALLEAAGYLVVKKGFVGKTPRTTLALSAAGRRGWKAHLAALRDIAGQL